MSAEAVTAILERLDRIEKLLDAHAARDDRSIPDHPLSIAEVARITGKNAKTVRRWIRRGALKARREGRAWFVMPGNLRLFLFPQEAR